MILIRLFVVLLSTLSIGCSTPSSSFHHQARNLGFYPQTYGGVDFIHQVYVARNPLRKFLHVYLGSDGTPWKTPKQIALDPTPRNPIMLRLMALDFSASVYVGRPCYHGLSQSPGCHQKWWTSARYSESVVKSLSSVLTQLSEEYDKRPMVLFGYSGGGALAMLLANRLPFVQGVVTLAGNLDIEAWTGYHSFSALTESLNPASLPSLGNQIVQIHFLGGQDKVVPPHLVEKTIMRQGKRSRMVIENVDHHCCWEKLWPTLLREVNRRLGKKIP